ncbi:neutral/alkaline non-lysosomal ceramidase N-terminal domain-containing protein [Paenibacillus sp. HJGM_3]|uniref:neutral/alkaline non-lysosomal ceramidase N-terminal domain-containing protein n=1 Tax=Paenibacillus sp. HJGM_3 TaxID=3379816 RepID=UPI00385B05EB
MKFSLSKADITPQTPVWMAGFGDRTHESEGIHDPIFAKAVLLQANKTLLILTLDLSGGDRSFIVGIKTILEETFGLKHDEVLINFSHTHHAVAARGETHGERDPMYRSAIDYRFIRDTIVRLVTECCSNLEEGQLLLGRGTSIFGVSRRKLTDKGVLWKPTYNTPIDHDLFVFQLLNAAGERKGIIYSYGCHPTSMSSDNYLISNDFPGRTNSYLEETYPGTMAVFLQGCAGEIKPLKCSVGDDFISCTFEQMEEAGVDLAKDIVRVLEKQPFTPVQGVFKSILVEASLFMEHTPIEFFEAIVNNPQIGEVRRRGAQRKIKLFQEGLAKDRTSIYICIWHLDEDTRLIAMEGEISTEYSMLLKQLFPGGKTIVLGYSNGVTFYVPTRKMIGEGGYEVDYLHIGGPYTGIFLPEIEDIIVGQITKADLALRKSEASVN